MRNYEIWGLISPEGPARHLSASWQTLTPHCLGAIFGLQLPSHKLSLKMPLKMLDPTYASLRLLSGPVSRDLSDTPLLRAMVYLVSQHGQLGAIPPPPLLSVSPFESMRSGGAIPPPPPKKGFLSNTCAIPYENKANGCDTPL